MADTTTALKRSRLTRGKTALIGVLAVLLIGVLYMQFGQRGEAGSDSESAAYAPRRPVPITPLSGSPTGAQAKQVQAVNKSPSAAAAAVDETRWKSPKLSDVVDYDPFALPAAFPKPQLNETAGANSEGLVAEAAEDDAKKLAEEVARLQMALRELKESGVQVIVREGDQYVAMIGDRTVHVGEEIKGFTVTGIDQDGVRIERKATQ